MEKEKQKEKAEKYIWQKWTEFPYKKSRWMPGLLIFLGFQVFNNSKVIMHISVIRKKCLFFLRKKKENRYF